MGRKRSAAGFFSQGAAGWRLLPGLVAAALVLWLAFLPGCNSQGASRQSNQQFRPIGNTARLMQNASYYRKVGRVELAVDELEQARMKEPNNLELLDILIQCYEDLGDFDRAQELYEQALAKQGGDQPAWENNRCYSLYLQGRLDQAETCFRKALARQPDNQKARNNLGLVLCRQGREAEALAMWREALSDTAARQRMGEAMAALGKDVPPSLAGPLPPAAPSQITAAAGPPAPPAVAALTPKAVPTASPAPTAAIAAPQPVTPTDVLISRATGEAEKPAPLKLPPPHVQAATGPPAQPPAAPEPAEAKTASPKPEPTPLATAAAPARMASPSAKAPTAPPVAAAMVTKPKPTILTALELADTRIEVKNGNGIPGQARDIRSGLCLEGYNVVNIGNHIDFGLEATVIAYRPGAARVAQNLARNFFPNARLEESGNLSHWADVRISLGLDQVSGQNIARLRQETPAAHASVPLPTPGRETTAPARKNLEYRANKLAAASEGPPPDYLTAQELHQARIELRNGNGIPGEAWEVSGHLAMEGFTIINVGNNQDFDLEKTVIAYRPGAARVARVLSKKFFPKATLAEEGQLPPWMDVRVSLGRDLVDGHSQVAQAFSGALVP